MAADTCEKRRSKIATLVRAGHSAEFAGPMAKELMQLFRMIWHMPRVHNGAVELVTKTVPMLHHSGYLRISCFAGLADLIIEQLRRLGYRVKDRGRTVDARLRRLGVPLPIHIPTQPSLDTALLQHVLMNERGMIYYDALRVDPVWLLMQVALAWPKRRIACAVTRIDDAYRLRRELQSHIKDGILVITHRPGPELAARIVIGTYGAFGKGEAEIHNRDFVFALNPLEMLQNSDAIELILQADRSRLFGLLPIDQRLTSWERDGCLNVFGPHPLVIPYHGQIQRQIQAAFLPLKGGVAGWDGGSSSDLQRQGIWTHRNRNLRVARLAEAIASEDGQTMARAGATKGLNKMIQQCGVNPGIAVLVANLEQAIPLCRQLEGWQLIAGDTMRTLNLRQKDVDVLLRAADQMASLNKGAIITRRGLQDAGTYDVLVRADAGVGAIVTDWANYSPRGTMSLPPAVVVDFRDRHHPEFRKRSRQRKQAYLEAGWRLPLDYPTALDQFIALRPNCVIARR